MKNSYDPSKIVRWLFLYSALGYMIYSAIGNNFLTNPDSSVFLVYKYAQMESDFGRIGLKYIDNIFGKVVSPPFAVIGTVLLYSVIIVLLVEYFDVDSAISKILLGLFIFLSPTTINLVTYHCFSIPYTVGYFFVVFAVSIIKNRHLFNWNVIIASLLMAMSLTMYQAYLPVGILLMVMMVLVMIIRKQDVRDILLFVFRGFVSSTLGILLYIVVLKISNTALTSSRSFDKMGFINIGNIPNLVYRSYHNFFQLYLGDELINNHFLHRNMWNGVVLFGIIGLFIANFISSKAYTNAVNMFIFICAVVLLPVFFELITIMAPDVNSTGTTGIIIVPTMPYLYCLFLLLIEELNRSLSHRLGLRQMIVGIGVAMCTPILIVHISFVALFTNQLWLNLNQMKTLCNSIVYNVWDEFGYSKDDTLLITGSKEDGNFESNWHDQKDNLKGTLAYYGYSWGGWLSNWCYTSFMDYYCGVKYKYGDINTYNEVINMDEWKNMPSYPNKGSIRRINDVLVIKLSDIND